MSADQRFEEFAAELGCRFDGEITIDGNYLPLRRHAAEIYGSGQIPRVGERVLGEAGAHTRTSVGAWRLPKNATLELDLIAMAAA